jgi:predicted naringenin-chalcone synthase
VSGPQHHPAILALGTAVPPYRRQQHTVGQWMAESFGARRRLGRLILALHRYSGIETRYACTPHYHQPPNESPLAPGATLERSASTAKRMRLYEQASIPLGTSAAQQALATYAHKSDQSIQAVAQTITHLIAISCTGFFAPGLDFALVKCLRLPPTVRRTLIGFMGCAAAFNGLRAAMEIVRGQPDARVLLVSVELCSLHTQPGGDDDFLVGASIFSDGAAACLVGQPGPSEGDCFRLDDFYTAIEPDTETEMAWQIRDHGFVLHLSPDIPDHLATAAPNALSHLFGDEQPQFWAIHPGGRAIVDRLAEIFALSDTTLAATRHTLRDYGNMSSATILFVLAALQQSLRCGVNSHQHAGHAALTGVAMAFGPGLVVEMGRLTYVPPFPEPPDPQTRAANVNGQAGGTRHHA